MLDTYFGPDGYLSTCFEGYEARKGQVAIARTISEAMKTGQNALCEGPTGTGKSLAYCVPSIEQAAKGKRTVIATANIALQEQLVTKDLPFLEGGPVSFSFALLKGKSNYACLRNTRGLVAGEDNTELTSILEWLKGTEEGDKTELPFVPTLDSWGTVSSSSDDCDGKHCDFYDSCYATKARRRADVSHIVVVNQHLLFAHLSVGGGVIPEHDTVVIDEAHKAPDIAREFFGFRVTEKSVTRLKSHAPTKLALEMAESAFEFFSALSDYERSSRYQKRLKSKAVVPSERLTLALGVFSSNQSAIVNEGCEDYNCLCSKCADAYKAQKRMVQADNIIDRVNLAMDLEDDNSVYFIERNRKTVALCSKPIDVAPLLHDRLFSPMHSVCLTSATLTTGGDFSHCKRQTGIPLGCLEVVAAPAFDYMEQCFLVLPKDLPNPNSDRFPAEVARAFAEVIAQCDGRTLGLFTSYRMLNATYESLYGTLPHMLMRQGDAPRGDLTRAFKEDTSSVLLGTESFWTGVDVKGEALTAVVIDKLPFPHPHDPVVDAIDDWAGYCVPTAIIALRQGMGRLIRSKTDVGVVVILDPRILSWWGKSFFLSSIERCPNSRDIADIRPWLESKAA